MVMMVVVSCAGPDGLAGRSGELIDMSRAFRRAVLLLPVIILLSCCAPYPAKQNDAGGHRSGEPAKIRIVLVGDFLMHMPLVASARTENGGYDFTEIFKESRYYLENADFTVANLETRLAGPDKGYSGYPRFNTPAELADTLKKLGIDLVTTANNHSMDMGRDGVVKTLEHLDRAGLKHVGTHRSRQERDQPVIADIRGIRVGFINYTQYTNGLPVPADADYLVNVLTRDAVLEEINRLKENNCQFIIAHMHTGTEYQRQPNQFQRTLARELFAAGVDVVMGSHPHVVQPLEWHRVFLDGREKQVLAAYSLGNFVSNQRWRYSDCGIMLCLEITKDENGRALLDKASYIPVWVDTYRRDNQTKFRVLPVQKALWDYESKKDPLLTGTDYLLLKQAWQDTTSLIGPEFSAGS